MLPTGKEGFLREQKGQKIVRVSRDTNSPGDRGRSQDNCARLTHVLKWLKTSCWKNKNKFQKKSSIVTEVKTNAALHHTGP